MTLKISDIANNPDRFKKSITSKTGLQFIFRPLVKSDLSTLLSFIDSLSSQTKKFYSYTKSSKAIATEICQAINKYDKLRFVLENNETKEIVGMFEFSFDIPISDIKRFKNYKINLSSELDCRIGPVLQDKYQAKGLGSQILPLLRNFGIQFGQNRIILWGGVHKDNPQAINYYKKNNFKQLGIFRNQDNTECYDMILDLNTKF